MTGVTMSESLRTLVPVILIGLGVCWLIVCAVMLWRWRQQSRQWREQTSRWQHESRVNQRISELLKQEYEQLLGPEERQRREAQRRHLEELRARAEAELAAEAAHRERP
jgi:C4-dicarboxylate-specific signal transduction histidine kinase